MIPDPQNVFEALQNDVAEQLMATPPFTTIKFPDGSVFKVLTQDEGDIQFEYDAMISQLGLSIVVGRPTGKIEQPDLPGPLITKLGFDVVVSEAKEFNKSELGTKIRIWKASTVVMGTLHGFQPESIKSPVYADNFTSEEHRIHWNEEDTTGTLITRMICHFIAPQVAAEITT